MKINKELLEAIREMNKSSEATNEPEVKRLVKNSGVTHTLEEWNNDKTLRAILFAVSIMVYQVDSKQRDGDEVKEEIESILVNRQVMHFLQIAVLLGMALVGSTEKSNPDPTEGRIDDILSQILRKSNENNEGSS